MLSRFLLAILLAVSVQSDASQSVFARNGVVAVEVSPDANYLAIFKRLGDIDELFVINVSESRIVNQRVTTSPERIYSIAWIDDEQLALQVGEDMRYQVMPQQTGVVDILTVAGGSMRLGADAESQGDPPDLAGKLSVVAGVPNITGVMLVESLEDSNLWIVDIVGGSVESLEYPPLRNPEFTVSTDLRFVAAAGHDDDGNIRVTITRPNENTGWTNIDDGLQPLRFDEDGTLYALRPTGEGRLGLAAFDMFSGEINTLFQDDENNVDEVLFNRDGVPFAIRYLSGFPSWHYLDSDQPLAKLHRSLSAAAPRHDVSFISGSLDDSLLVAEMSTDDRPSTYFLVDTVNGRTEKLLDAHSGLWIAGGEDSAIYSYQPFDVQFDDDRNVSGYISTPETSNTRRLSRPLVVLLRDQAAQSPWKWEFDVDVWNLNRQGYNVLMSNHSDISSPADPVEVGAAIEWARDNGFIDDDRICLMGRGSGANLALRAVAQYDNLTCLIGMSGDFEAADSLADGVVTAADDENEIQILLIFGADDDQHVESNDNLSASLTRPGISVKTLKVPDESTVFSSSASEARAFAEVEIFLRRTIGYNRSQPALPLNYHQAVSLSQLLSQFQSVDSSGRATRTRAWFRARDKDFRGLLSDEQVQIFDRYVSMEIVRPRHGRLGAVPFTGQDAPQSAPTPVSRL